MKRRPSLLLTCEHGGNRIPARWARFFQGAEDLLDTHRGYDLGALKVARVLERTLNCPLFAVSISRQLVDLNRSLHHPNLFSAFTKGLPEEERRRILDRHYLPFRSQVADWIEEQLERRDAWVLHLSVHSFTPRLKGEERNADVGLLYDPGRAREKAIVTKVLAELKERGWRVRRNYPYLGVADGHTTALRRRFGQRYVGIEIEMNQKTLHQNGNTVARNLAQAIACVI